MIIVTTLSYDELSTLIREKKVSLNNESLLLGEHYELVSDYITDRLGSDGFVMAVRGEINNSTVKDFIEIDENLKVNRVIIESPVDKDDLLVFSAMGLKKALDLLRSGYFSDETVVEALDEAQSKLGDNELEIICTPYIKKSGSIRITSPYREIDVSAAGLTFVKLNGGAKNE